MRTSRFSEEQVASIIGRADEGVPVAELCRECGISNSLLYNRLTMY